MDAARRSDAAADGYRPRRRLRRCAAETPPRMPNVTAMPDAAVIQGSAVNHDRPSSGLDRPRQPGEIAAALANAHVTPDEVAYVEAARARPSVTRCSTPWAPCSNWRGPSAAAVSNQLKQILGILRHMPAWPHEPHFGSAPRANSAILHFSVPNPYSQWDEFVPSRCQPACNPRPNWALIGTMAGVSAFGMSGPKCAISYGGSPTCSAGNITSRTGCRPHAGTLPAFSLSAKSPTALSRVVQRYLAHCMWA